MVEHTQIIRRQQPTNCLSVFDHFMGLALKDLIHFSSVLYFYSSYKRFQWVQKYNPSLKWIKHIDVQSYSAQIKLSLLGL